MTKQAGVLIGALMVLCAGLSFGSSVTEEDIPEPEVVYELPQEILGSFVIPHAYDNITMTIFESNKYLIHSDGDDYSSDEYGHVIRISDSFALHPIYDSIHTSPSLISEPSEIVPTADGLDIVSSERSRRALRAREKRISGKARNITVESQATTRLLFLVTTVGGDRIEVSHTVLERFPSYINLIIRQGEIYIAVHLGDGTVSWRGFISNLVSASEETSGTIYFTGGAAFFFTDEGLGSLQIIGDVVRIEIEPNRFYLANLEKALDKELSHVLLVMEFDTANPPPEPDPEEY